MKKYDNYKESGIEWLGKIPENWTLTKLKYYLSIQSGGGINNSEIDENANYYIYGGNGIMGKTNNTNSSGEVLIIGRVGALCGNVHLVEDDIWISDNALWGKSNQNQKFLYYYLKYLDLNRLANKNAQPLITGTMVKEQFIGLPSKEEQTTIATYLDHKTTQIDTLIEKKEKLIEKLKQQRQAIINEAVTKGLNPDAPMKDSGIEWLDDIPSNWKVVNFRYLIDVLTDYTANGSFGDLAKNVDYLDEGYSRLIRLTDLRANYENVGIFLNEHSHNYLSKSELYGGEVLLANVGAYAGLAWVFQNFKGKASLGPNMFLLRFKENLDNNYAYFSLISDYLHTQLLNKATSSAQPKLNKEDVRSCHFVLPSKMEQIEIAKHIKEKTKKVELVLSKINSSIEKLKLYRQSIISEAVTGKIDVRDWKKPEKK